MGQAASRQAETLETQVAQPVPHPELGFVFETHVDFVSDPAQRDASGQPKWRLLRPNSRTLVLNDKYALTPDEVDVLKVGLMYYVLKSEDTIRDFFTVMDAESRARVAGEAAEVLWQRGRNAFERWRRTLDDVFCALPGLEFETAPRVRQWLRDRGQSDKGSPGELYARFCAFRTGTLKPTPVIFSWLDRMGLDYHDNPSVGIQLYTAAHMRGEDLPALGAAKNKPLDPFAALRERLLQESNALYADMDMRKLLLLPESASARGLKFVRYRAQLSVFRSKHLPRTVLWDLLNNAGVTCLPAQTPTRVLDRLYRELMTDDATVNPRLLRRCLALASKPGTDPNLELVLRREQMRDPLRYARDRFIQHSFQEPKSPDEYVDKLLEYGAIWFFHPSHPLTLSKEQGAALATAAGFASEPELIERIEAGLTEDFLHSWLEDRGIAVAPGLSLQTMLNKYRDLCMMCYGPAGNKDRCLDVLSVDDLKTVDVWPQASQTQQTAPQAAQAEEDALLTALRLYTLDFDPDNSEDAARLRKMARLLRVDPSGDEDEVASRVVSALQARLAQDNNAILLDLLLQEHHGQSYQMPSTMTRKFRELSRVNRKRIDAVTPASIQALLTNPTRFDALLKLGYNPADDEQAKRDAAALLDTYVSRELLNQIAQLHLSKPFTAPSALSLLQ